MMAAITKSRHAFSHSPTSSVTSYSLGSNNKKYGLSVVRFAFVFGAAVGFISSMIVFHATTSIVPSTVRERHHLVDVSSATTFRRSLSAPEQIESGWKTVHVYFGSDKHIADASAIPTPYFGANKWFSQYRQDEIVSRLLHNKRNGFFIDLAANDAVRISNTYALEKNFGWNGICLEPNAEYWPGLSYRKCEVVAAVVGDSNMEEINFKFSKGKGPKGGIIGSQFDNKEDSFGESQRRYTVKLVDVLRKFGAPKVIDYISLDVEGAEDLVMNAFPYSEYRFNVLTIERPSEALRTLLQNNGYEFLRYLKKPTESIWIHHSIHDAIDNSAMAMDTENYKYKENTAAERVAPEDKKQNNAVREE